jgi:hypothetical protein
MDLNKLIKSRQGDILILDDFNSLEAIGKALETKINEVNTYTIDGSDLTYYAFEVEHEDLEMTLLVKVVGGESEIRMFTKFTEGSFSEFVDHVPSDFEDQDGGLPTGFILDPSNGDEEDEYLANDPFPIHGFDKNNRVMCAIGEYTYNGEADSTYCAKHAWIEWYISDDEDDDNLDDYHALYFGWDVNINDVDVLQG